MKIDRGNCPPIGSGGCYIFELGAGSFGKRLEYNPQAVPSDTEINAVWSLVQEHGAVALVGFAHERDRDAARILVDFVETVKGEK